MEIRVRGYGKSYKAGYEMCLQDIREHYKKLNITDVEPWSIYKISGSWLFELEKMLDANFWYDKAKSLKLDRVPSSRKQKG